MSDRTEPTRVDEVPVGAQSSTHTLDMSELAGARREGVPQAAAEPAVAASALFADPSRPPKIGRYELRKWLGSGGMGVVYAAHDPELDRIVALKVLHAEQAAYSDELRLQREAKAMARLSHPNVVTVHDVGTHEGRVFLAMEFIDGMTLRKWTRQRPHGWRQVLEVFLQAGRGLAAAHAAGLVHRDFKPDNVLIGHDGRVCVTDFGLARRVGGAVEPETTGDPAEPTESAPDAVTLDGTVVGTPAYMAPEQQLGEPTDARTDQFAFCVAMWEALAGERPFGRGSLFELADRVATGKLNPFPQEADAPAWLRRVLVRGLSRDPADRFPSMGAVLDVILELAGTTKLEPSKHEAANLLTEQVPSERARVAVLDGRYRVLDRLGDGSIGPIHRTLDRMTGQVVTVWRPGEEELTLSTGGLGRAHAATALHLPVLASVRHPHLASVLDFGFDEDDLPYFVLDLRENVQTILAAGRDQPSSIQISLLVQVLRALAYLHGRGLVHGDLRPATALVADGHTRLIYCGSAISRHRRPEEAEVLAHRAPEVLLGEQSGAPADLYAVGVLAYELLTGRHPFSTGGAAPLTDEVLTRAPRLDVSELEPRLAKVIARLLEKSPGARYQSAAEVIDALASATGQALAVETVQTRESFLQAGPFVGRAAEMLRLRGMLEQATAGNGHACLIGGESGVGKSRLLDELWPFAVGAGALVVRGQAMAEARPAYQPWANVVRRLAMVTELSDMEIAVLAAVAPGIEALCDRDVSAAPELDAPSMHARLVKVLHAMLFRQERPVMVLLEDLQWADVESVSLLHELTTALAEVPVLILATYRDDESRELPERVPAMELLSIGRLSDEAIVELSEATFHAGSRAQELSRFLARETEGNAFFLVEVMRVLAEEAGQIDKVASIQLPKGVLAGGMRRVIQRRLGQLSDELRPLMSTAATIGRQLDLELLETITGHEDLDAQLRACADAGVVERRAGGWQFCHDKLREGLLEQLSEAERRDVHRRVAQSMESSRKDDPQAAAALAHHFGAAGDRERQSHYSELAGEHALRGGAYTEAVEQLEPALAYQAGDVSPLRRARLHRKLADAYYIIGDFGRARRHATHAFEHLGLDVPQSRAGWLVFLLWQLLVQLLHVYVLPQRPRRSDAAAERNVEISRTAEVMSTLYIYDNNLPGVLGESLRSVNHGDRAGHTNMRSVGVLGLATGAMQLHGLARRYFARGRELPDDRDELPHAVSIAVTQGAYLIGVGALDEAREILAERRELARSIGYGLGVMLTEYLLGVTNYYSGRFAAMLAQARTAEAVVGTELRRHLDSIGPATALALTMVGDLQGAQARYERCLETVSPEERLVQGIIHGGLAGVHARRGNITDAVASADAAMELFTRAAAIPGTSPQFLAGVAEAYQAAYEAAQREGREPDRELAAKLERVVKELDTWSRTFPVGRAMALIHRGRYAAACGRTDRAEELLVQARSTAAGALQTYFEGLADLELARLLLGDADARAHHLRLAREAFAATGAVFELQQVDELAAA